MATRRSFLALTASEATQVTVPSLALEQAFPSKSIHFIVPFPAGGSADFLARLVGQHMTQQVLDLIGVRCLSRVGSYMGSAEGNRKNSVTWQCPGTLPDNDQFQA